MSTSTPTVELSGVRKRFGRTVALDDISLGFEPGITGLLGPNGAGKTTLLRILATALAADSGRVSVLGNDPDTTSGRVAIRRHLGYLPQEAGFPRGFTAFGFVDYFAILKEWTDRGARHAEVRRVLGQAGLADVATKRVHVLSGGQRRRLLLAQALLGEPQFLVLDEPTNGLDPEQRARLRDTLSTAGQTATLVLSTHQTEDVAAVCGRVVVIDDGRVHFDGSVAELVSRADGRVWLAAARDTGAVHSWRTGSGRWRNVGDRPPEAVPVEPTLEDAYLLLVGDRALGAAMGVAS
ncbi:MAG: ATP-binding cassette domain-containing protein [Pedococcus sp.]